MDATQAKILEHQMAVLRKDMATSLNQMAEALTGMIGAHRAFQVYVQEQLTELRKAAGLPEATVAEGDEHEPFASR